MLRAVDHVNEGLCSFPKNLRKVCTQKCNPMYDFTIPYRETIPTLSIYEINIFLSETRRLTSIIWIRV